MPLSLLPMQIGAAPGLWGEPKGDATSAFRSLMNVRSWRNSAVSPPSVDPDKRTEGEDLDQLFLNRDRYWQYSSEAPQVRASDRAWIGLAIMTTKRVRLLPISSRRSLVMFDVVS